jgi:hypothetical protein
MLAFCRRQAHMSVMGRYVDPTDYSVVVKHRASPPNPWRWEIYRAGRVSPVERSYVYFGSRGTANVAGKEALARLLDKLEAWPPRMPT